MNEAKIISIKKIDYNNQVFNLHIEDNHNYFANGILVSNCHGAKSKSIQDIGKKCINAEYRLGFTGTLPEELVDKYNIFGYLGPQIHEFNNEQAIEKQILSKISIANIILEYPRELVQLCKECDYQQEVELITNFKKRNKVFDWIFKNIPQGQNSLILCNLIEHLKTLEEYCKTNFGKNHNIYIIYGAVDAEEREEIRTSLEKEGNVILIGTYATCSTGMNIKKLHNVIFASSYKSKIRILQSIGRGLRKHETKEKLTLFDIIDDLSYKNNKDNWVNNYVYNHFYIRLKYYKQNGFDYVTKRLKINDFPGVFDEQ